MIEFDVISGLHIKKILDKNVARSIQTVADTYLAHHDGKTVNPDSYFLRFPNNERNRIIALPASIDAETNVSGIKWIASFPDNIHSGLQRASAVLVLNDQTTGYPFALLEGSLISAVRTAASAVLAARWFNHQRKQVSSIGLIGAGVISRNILEMFLADEWTFESIRIRDLDADSSSAFAAYAATVTTCTDIAEVSLARALQSDIVVFATNAGVPYVLPPMAFAPGQIILNI